MIRPDVVNHARAHGETQRERYEHRAPRGLDPSADGGRATEMSQTGILTNTDCLRASFKKS